MEATERRGGRSSSGANAAVGRDELIAAIRKVRRRWRARVALRGLAAVVAATLVALLIGAWVMEVFRFHPTAIVVARVLVYAAAAGAAFRFLAMPLARRVSDERVALYVEEHDPSLQAALVSALGAEEGAGGSAALARELVQQAVRRVRTLDLSRRVERRRLRVSAAIAVGVAAIGAVATALGPAFVRSGARLVFWPWETAEAATPYSIAVQPGAVTVPRGADVAVSAQLRGFDAEGGAELSVRRGAAVEWERIPMSAGRRPGEYAVRIFNVDSASEYAVEAEGVRSPVYAIAVADLPYVRTISLEYTYPAYTGLAPQTVEDGGDVAALRGTKVLVRATPTAPVRGGRIVVEGGDTIPLSPADSGALAGTLRVSRNGFYRVELVTPDGATVRGSLDYVIDVLPDNPPTVSVEEPGRDVRVTRLEEVFASVRADDDYGVQRVDLVYSVNGGPERTVVLHSSGGRRTPEVSAGHTFFLEEMPLEPGDFVSYYARARDNDAVSGAHTATTDIYFMQVRPFDRRYRQAEQAGGAGGRQETPNAFSERQREIVAATFKLARDRATTPERQWREDITTLALAQARLREQVEGLADRVRQRGGAVPDSALRQIAEALPLAAAEMRAAEEQLGGRRASEALPPEQRALQQLQRAEAAFRDVQVSMGGGGGGQGGQQSTPEDLADLFGLDTDKLRNQYETVERGRQEQQEADAEVDRTLQRVKELAARQQRQAEELRRQADAMRAGGGGGGGGSAQRQLAEEAERLARQLERLERERPSPELRQSIRRLQEAASEMRRAAAGQGGSSATATAASAADRLREAERALANSRASRLERDVRDAQQRAAELADQQRRAAAEAERLAGAGDRRDGSDMERLLQRKDSLAAGVAALERELDRMARETRRDQPEGSRKLQAAANAIRDSQLRERLRFSKDVARAGSAEYARNLEEQITGNVDDVRRKVDDAAAAIRAPDSRRSAQALDKARELARGMESLGERMRQRREEAGTAARSGGQSPSERGAEPPNGRRARADGGARPGQDAEGTKGGEGNQSAQGAAGAAGQSRTDAGGQPGGAPGFGLGGGGQGAAVGGAGRGRYTPEDARQFGREVERRRAEAEELRRALGRQGYGTADLDALIARMRELERQRVYDDPEEVERLQAAVVEGLKAFEFALRRRVEGEQGDPPRLGGSDDVPAEFRALVEEYYRALARGRQR